MEHTLNHSTENLPQKSKENVCYIKENVCYFKVKGLALGEEKNATTKKPNTLTPCKALSRSNVYTHNMCLQDNID